MKTHIIVAALAVAISSQAFAQSSTATSGTTKPMQSAPAAGAVQNGGKVVIPPAARSGRKGLAVGPGAVTGGNPVGIKRVK